MNEIELRMSHGPALVIRTKDHSVISEIRKIFYETAYTTMGI
jgi:hypothetical protein